jgi:hypothetical protein
MTAQEKQIRIEALVERFFEGATSGAEERELYDYFASDGVPLELEPYRPLFRYIDREMPAALPASDARSPLPRRRFAIRTAGIAAVVAALIAVGAAVGLQKARERNDRFAGSYIIRNGVRITDPKIIRPELEAAMRLFEEREPRVSIADRKRAIYEEAISQFADEAVREAVRSKLHIQ